MRFRLPTILCALAAALSWPAALARDPVPLYPDNYKVIVENDRVRVLDFRLRKGDTEEMHSHPAHVLYVLQGFKVRFTLPDGLTRIRETKTGDVLYSDAVTHSPVNIGDTDAHGILVELKSAAPAASGGAAGIAAGGAAPSSLTADPGLLTAVTFIRGAEGREMELERELLALAAPTRAEPGNILYDLYQSTDRKNQFMRLEVWRDPEALEIHKRTPHIQASFEKRRRQGWTTEITTWRRVPE
jgi:quinol monooxygenase YgiN/quercetin dioxygenase-like cupin family protein